jgi:hypothetical protein
MGTEILSMFWTSVPIDWLLDGSVFVRYRTFRDLLDLAEKHADVQQARMQISEDPGVKRILRKRNASGYWGTSEDIFKWWPKRDSTFWVLSVLADLGLRRHDNGIEIACEYVFSTQLPDGGFGLRSPPKPYDCFTGVLAETLAKSGYIGDERLVRAYTWLFQRQRLDGGFWCKNTGQPGGSRQKEPSCALATLFVLRALAVHPEMNESVAAKRSADFILRCRENRGKIKYAGHDSQIGTGWEKLKYPFTDFRILAYLDTLSMLTCVRNDHRLLEMVKLLVSKKDSESTFTPESIHNVWSDFDFGQKKNPSRWITLFVYRILKRLALIGTDEVSL